MCASFYVITGNSGSFSRGTQASGEVGAFDNSGQLVFADDDGSIILTIKDVEGGTNQAISASSVSSDLTFTGTADGVGTLAWDDDEAGADGSPSTITISI